MEYAMTVFESEAYRGSKPEDAARFDKSYQALEAAGIHIRRVMCASAADIDGKEAAEIVAEKGMSALPIAEFQGVSISEGEYPSDQDLADFLDAPDGTLSVNKTAPPSMNDLAPACACGPTR